MQFYETVAILTVMFLLWIISCVQSWGVAKVK